MLDKNRLFSKNAGMKVSTHQSPLARWAFRLTILGLALVPMCSQAQMSGPMVGVGNPGNPADTTGYGSVGYHYDIGMYEVLNWQYTAFLNAVGAADTYNLYNTSMASDARGGITRSGVAGSYSYSFKPGYGNMPVVFVSYYDALRFANWIQNGQPGGPEGPGTTETGTYTFAGETVVGGRNALTTFYALASENEWYKAAYYDQSLNSGTGGYWLYPTRSNVIPNSRTPPNNTDANSGNFSRDDGIANGYNGGFAVTQSTVFNNGVNYLSDAGAYSLASSYYGTFDQGGNVFEWSEAGVGTGVIRGGSWDQSEARLRATSRLGPAAGFENYNLGFRLVYIPEPSAFALLGVGVLLLLAGQRVGRR
jgi:sulfatase modifying factor 1